MGITTLMASETPVISSSATTRFAESLRLPILLGEIQGRRLHYNNGRYTTDVEVAKVIRVIDKPSTKAFVSYFFCIFLFFLASKPSVRNMLSIHFSG